MALEPKTGRIEVDFNTDTFEVTLLLSKEQADTLNLQPGEKRTLIFRKQDVFWR
jgi:hypothetical protein